MATASKNLKRKLRASCFVPNTSVQVGQQITPSEVHSLIPQASYVQGDQCGKGTPTLI